MLRCGRIKYTNDLPIYAAFDEGIVAYPGTLHADVPAQLNAMMLAGELDLSPMSAFAYAKDHEEYVLLPDLCIGARDEVVSVVLVSGRPPRLLEDATIAVSRESATGVNLLRVLLERRYGVNARLTESDDPLQAARSGEAALLIGDRAIDALLEFPQEHVYDLGMLWHDWTGEQTVFAVWAARKEIYEKHRSEVRACMDALTDSYTWSRGHMETVVARAQQIVARPPGFYERYYANLNFTFHSAAQRGLTAYYRELEKIGAIAGVPFLAPEAIGVATPSLLDRAAAGGRLSFEDGVRLYKEGDLHELGAAAHARRMQLYPTNVVTYVIDTTINYTNVCNVHCTFCAFFRPEKHKEGYTMSHDEVIERVKFAADQGATQIMIQGGVNPELGLDWFETLFQRVAREFPNVDIHSLSVSEVVGLSTIEQLPAREVLVRLKAAGMKSLPGAGAEILVERVRKRISARKVKPDDWIGVMREAQKLGMPTTATMMFGSIETPEERVMHLDVVRDLQDETGGFTAFIPWYYVPWKTPLRGKEASGLEYLRVLAVSRLYLDNVPHLQASWLTPGMKIGQLALFYGCDDMGGTIIEEKVVHDAGSTNEATRKDLEENIMGAGFVPIIRDTYWNLRDDIALATA